MTMTMRAAIFERAGEKLRIKNVPVPKPGPGELLIKVERCGVCGSDLHMTDNATCFHLQPGVTLGHEFCGEIVQLGEGTAGRWREGQRLAAFPFIGCGRCAHCLSGEPVWCRSARNLAIGEMPGGFAEYTVVGADEGLRLPDTMTWDEGAFVEPVAVAVHGVALANLAPGARVLVLGAGPIGLAVAACARAMGAGVVCVASRSDRRADLARRMGATEFLLNDEQLPAAFEKIAGGPPEVIFECVGLPGMVNLCSHLAGPRSTIIVLGCSLQVEGMEITVPTVKELKFHFSMCYSHREFAAALEMIASGRIDPCAMLTDVVSMSDFPDAFDGLRRPSTQCKILLSPSAA